MISGMEKGNISTMMVAIIMEIGLKGRCKERESFMMLMAIFNTKVNGRMIIMKEKVPYTA